MVLCQLSFQITVCLAVNLVEDVHRHGFSVPQTHQFFVYCTSHVSMISVGFYVLIIFLYGSTATSGPRPPHCLGFTITLKHTILGTSSPDMLSAHHRDLNLTIHKTHKRQTSLFPCGIQTAIPRSMWPQTHALAHADVWTHCVEIHFHKF